MNNQRKVEILEHFGSPEAVYMADERALSEISPNKKELKSLLDKNVAEADEILRCCDNKRISVLTWADASYPARLKAIINPPLVLYYDGRLPAFDSAATVGMVGTRKASLYGMEHAKQLGYQLGKSGAIVVSGIAEGIDGRCIEGALLSGAPVVSVLGNGIDVVYPRSHRRLYEDVRRYGCLITEFPPGTRPLRGNFPVRNRIISGLSLGVVVVEAPNPSGALITAQHALDQGRDVFALPANLEVSTYKGNFKLLKEGAILVEDALDVLRHYEGQYVLNTKSVPEKIPCVTDVTEVKTEKRIVLSDRKTVDRENPANYIEWNEALSKVSAEGAAILKALCSGQRHVDEIVELSGLPASKVSSAMTVLEIKKFVKRLPGQRFALAETIKVGEHHE